MVILGGRASRLAAAFVLGLAAACSSNVPQGFGSGDYTVERNVAAPCDAVWEAARAYLRERGDVPEVTTYEQGGVLRTGDLRIQVTPGGDDATRLLVHQAKYVGGDYAERAQAIADAIVERVE